jgi:hypothetical protein
VYNEEGYFSYGLLFDDWLQFKLFTSVNLYILATNPEGY